MDTYREGSTMKDAFAKPPGWVDPTPISIMQASNVGDLVIGGGGSTLRVVAHIDGMTFLSDDGKPFTSTEWHTAPACVCHELGATGTFQRHTRCRAHDEGDTVYVERWSGVGREFHGWVDRVSRKLVQSG